MRLNFKELVIRDLHISTQSHLPLQGMHQVVRKGNFDFDIFKKSVDVGKDLIRTNIHWTHRLHRYLPFIGLFIGLISFSLQTILILINKKYDKPTKIAAAFLFVALSSLAVGAFLLAETAPLVATALALSISILNFLADSFNFFTNFKSLNKLKKILYSLDEKKIEAEREKEKAFLLHSQARLSKQLQLQLLDLLAARVQRDEKLAENFIKKTHDTLNELVRVNEKIQDLYLPELRLKEQICTESQQLTIASAALTINVISISLVIFSLTTIGSIPVGISLLLCVNLLVDVAELTKNIVAKCKDNTRQKVIKKQRIERASQYVDRAFTHISISHKSSYAHMLDAMPKTKEKVIDRIRAPQKTPPETENISLTPNPASNNELQSTYQCIA
jgi:hypothetical protein